MATARKAPAKRAAPQQSAAAVKTMRARKTSVSKASLDDGGKASPLKKASVKRLLNGAAGHAEKAARASKAKASKPNGAADAPGIQEFARDGEATRKTRAGSSTEAAVPVQISARAPSDTRPPYWDGACADLVKRDRILKKLIPKFGPVHLINGGDPFVTLARSVVGQQISVQAAQAVWQRIEAACPKLTPQQFIKLGQEKLVACGLSKRKTEYILDLAQHFVSGALHVDKWMSMEDEAVIAELTQIRGIGRWTAEMFLIFNLSRPDVLPLDDLGLIRAISVNYFSGEPVTRSEAREVAANWEPWRTVATWYMWRSLDPLANGD
ncbi:DNA-3-methyladenine glycosylase 2 family protein [Trinickia terrae]|uniref:DNA-3-methyladenine glycosylase II n=1 Tax=Trinickia terrae TaxID=2571161 RepID=A0A4U1HQQ7_9BURK|nr:DNA-3-methyladenine glycosylase [Trinickia terrae]TKC82643.1 DNA-3-methyladenine glycosylase 2 family protein [Trinickia terrae]